MRLGRDMVEDRVEVGKSRQRVAKIHKPCLAHAARTCRRSRIRHGSRQLSKPR